MIILTLNSGDHVLFRMAKIGQLNKPVLENAFVYTFFLVNFFDVRKNDTGTDGKMKKTTAQPHKMLLLVQLQL